MRRRGSFTTTPVRARRRAVARLWTKTSLLAHPSSTVSRRCAPSFETLPPTHWLGPYPLPNTSTSSAGGLPSVMTDGCAFPSLGSAGNSRRRFRRPVQDRRGTGRDRARPAGRPVKPRRGRAARSRPLRAGEAVEQHAPIGRDVHGLHVGRVVGAQRMTGPAGPRPVPRAPRERRGPWEVVRRAAPLTEVAPSRTVGADWTS